MSWSLPDGPNENLVSIRAVYDVFEIDLPATDGTVTITTPFPRALTA